MAARNKMAVRERFQTMLHPSCIDTLSDLSICAHLFKKESFLSVRAFFSFCLLLVPAGRREQRAGDRRWLGRTIGQHRLADRQRRGTTHLGLHVSDLNAETL